MREMAFFLIGMMEGAWFFWAWATGVFDE